MSGIYAADGSFNVTVVDGTSYTGVMAADGSYNVIKSPGNAEVGAYHPCGAYWVTLTDGSKTGYRAPDGSLYITDSPYTLNGAAKVTVVSGTLHPGGGAPFLFYIFV